MGCWFEDTEGRRYLDFTSQAIELNLGHAHPRLVDAVRPQAETPYGLAPSFASESRSQLARLLAEVTPGDLGMTLFATGGATGVVPDIMTLAKGISGGADPLGVMVASEKLRQWLEEHEFASGLQLRGIGLLWGLELVRDRETRELLVPDAATGEAARPMAALMAGRHGPWPPPQHARERPAGRAAADRRAR